MIRNILILIANLLFGTYMYAGLSDSVDVARTQYQEGNYAEVASIYEGIEKGGYQSFELYYNMGNVYYKMNDFVRSVLYYERAYKLDPNDEDLLHNLEKVRAHQVDDIGSMENVFFVAKWYRSVVGAFSSNTWMYIGGISFCIALVAFYFFRFNQTTSVKRTSFFTALLFILCAIMSTVFSYNHKSLLEADKAGIVFANSVTIKSEPSVDSKDIFVIHEGLKVTILQMEGAWVRIEVDEEKNGWMLLEDLEII